MSQESAIPITLITGFLGAGKTTLLNHILRDDHDLRIAVIVNDFGTINLDVQLVEPANVPIITLENGCICCTLRSDFISTLHQLLEHPEPPEYILVEASGVSDPQQILLGLNRSNIRNYFQIDSLITVVDAEQFDDLDYKQKRLASSQIKMASVVVINKIDLVNAGQLAQLTTWIRQLAPQATLLEAVKAEVDVSDVIRLENYNPQTAFDTSGPGVHVYAVEDENEYQHNDHSLVFSTWTWKCTCELSLDALHDILVNLPLSVFRAKGVVAVPDNSYRLIVHMVGSRINIEAGAPWDGTPRQSYLTMIGEKGSLNTTDLQARFDASRATDAPDDIITVDSKTIQWKRQR